MQKQILYLCIVIAVLVRSSFAPITLLFYVVEQEKFVEYLCINTDQPELHCEGSCQLKKVGDFYKHQHKESKENIVLFSINWIVNNQEYISETQSQFNTKEFCSSYTNFYQFIFSKHDLKPPVV